MGSLSKLFAKGGGPRPRSNGSQSGPLRRIVEITYQGDVPWERLECGHEAPAKQDLMGYTNAARRRCWRCKREAT